MDTSLLQTVSYVLTKFSYISSKKKLLYYGPSLIRTTDTKSRPLGESSNSLLWTLRDKVSKICGICTISSWQLHKHWHFISQQYQYENNVLGEVFCFVPKFVCTEHVASEKYNNINQLTRHWVLGLINYLLNTLTCQYLWGLKSDVIIVTSLIWTPLSYGHFDLSLRCPH